MSGPICDGDLLELRFTRTGKYGPEVLVFHNGALATRDTIDGPLARDACTAKWARIARMSGASLWVDEAESESFAVADSRRFVERMVKP